MFITDVDRFLYVLKGVFPLSFARINWIERQHLWWRRRRKKVIDDGLRKSKTHPHRYPKSIFTSFYLFLGARCATRWNREWALIFFTLFPLLSNWSQGVGNPHVNVQIRNFRWFFFFHLPCLLINNQRFLLLFLSSILLSLWNWRREKIKWKKKYKSSSIIREDIFGICVRISSHTHTINLNKNLKIICRAKVIEQTLIKLCESDTRIFIVIVIAHSCEEITSFKMPMKFL